MSLKSCFREITEEKVFNSQDYEEKFSFILSAEPVSMGHSQ